MNILQVLPALNSGGVERGTLEIAEALVTAGHNSHLISNGGRLVATLTQQGSIHHQLPVHSKNPWHIWRNASLISDFVRKQDIELIHVRSRAPAWSAKLASQQTDVPLLSTFHGMYGHHSMLKRIYNSAMLSGQACIAVSDFIAQHIAQTYPKHPKLVTIHRGIDTQAFSPETVSDARKQILLEQWSLKSEQTKVILLPGRLTRLKGHALFIEALAQVKHEFLALIVGDQTSSEAYIGELQTLIDKKQLQGRVRFVGACDDMPAAYAVADIVVSASTKAESFGRTACEAQAMEKLVTVADHGGTRETLCPQLHNAAFEPGSSRSLATCLNMLLAIDSNEARELGRSARAHIEKHYPLEKMCAKTLALYQQLIS